MNFTIPTALVLQALVRGYHHGFDIIEATGLPSGTVYPILRRLERKHLVTSRWESADIAHRAGRPPRRYYEVSAAGRELLADAQARFPLLDGAVPARGKKLRPAGSRS
jgi:DNA-binding PadR family transcriptional regulator